jgi:FkbH-like protein/non-ribosomal peptide synthase protein (TIGR01720 family)
MYDLAPTQAVEVKGDQKQTIAVTATFVAEPIQRSLDFWMRELGIPITVKFSAYNQVFQQLLDPGNLFAQNRSGANVVLIRFEDWVRFQGEEPGTLTPAARAQLEQHAREWVAALNAAMKTAAVPYLVGFCPPAPCPVANAAFYTELEDRLKAELGNINGLYLITSSELEALYPTENFYDPHGDQEGHVPYSSLFFAALGTLIARKFWAMRGPAYKVIVLDCDQVLWKGVCGEEGVWGIEIDAARKTLQKFMVAQYEAGRLICLCSKNSEEDVLQVFQQRSDMVLKREHLVAWRINWQPKSQNLRTLADELQLNLDSFVFIDDNPLECAEIQAAYPEVLTLQLPAATERIPLFLNQIWALDRLKITEEDRTRTSQYIQNRQRELLRQQSQSFEDFLASLELRVSITKLIPGQLDRVAQLTQRTNQFNVTAIRHSALEIQALCQAGELNGWVVEVHDRFGDYGLVGCLLFKIQADALCIDTLLLSCRVLGKGIEHQMLAFLGQLAKSLQLGSVIVPYAPTPRNRPALDFLESVGAAYKGIDGVFKFPADYAANVIYRPQYTPPQQANTPGDQSAASLTLSSVGIRAAQFKRIAEELDDAEKILNAILARRAPRPKLKTPYVAPQTSAEAALTRIWAEVLGIEQVGIYDSFFELGGDSLLCLQSVYKANQAGLSLDSRQVFQQQTIAKLLAAKGAVRSIQAEQDVVTGLMPIPPNIDRTLAVNPADLHHLNMVTLLEVSWPPTLVELKQLALAMLRQHDMLRLRLVRESTGWSAFIADLDEQPPVTWVELSDLTELEQRRRFETVAAELQLSLNLSQGPIVRFAYFNFGRQKPGYFLLIVHHLVLDAVSMGIILEDLETAYRQIQQERPVRFSPKTTSFKYWAERLEAYAGEESLQAELAFWLTDLRRQVVPLPVDYPGGVNTGATRRIEKMTLSDQETRALLHTIPACNDARISEVIVAALTYAFTRWTGQNMLLDFGNHGRLDIFEDVDLARTVGFFTNNFPLLLIPNTSGDCADTLQSISHYLRSIPQHGIGYGLLRYRGAAETREKLRALPTAEVRLNYRGREDEHLSAAGPFRPVKGANFGPRFSLKNPLRYKIDIVGDIIAGCLQLEWKYSGELYSATTIKNLIQSCTEWIRLLIATN